MNRETTGVQRLRITVHGAVQGVGFRPFVFRLAQQLQLNGFVANTVCGVAIEVEGEPASLGTFLFRLRDEKPSLARIHDIESSYLDPRHYTSFEIGVSETLGVPETLVSPDIATCPDCIADIMDVANRRYRYPFTNCTHCGPRYSIIASLPYDRNNTSMKKFEMCDVCREEYENPLDRRFHAQPIACPVCGPHVELWDDQGKVMERDDAAIVHACENIRRGKIVAVKGLGGFHLFVDARNDEAVRTLRRRKRREEKPLAVMCPALSSVEDLCEMSPLERHLVTLPSAPIIVMKRKGHSTVADAVAPANPNLGVFLPYTPLHHLILEELDCPVVATSGNMSDEPICIDEHEALVRLREIADSFLVHNRPILRHVDDSVVRAICDREQVLRRARGYAPLPITLLEETPSLLAVGAHQKNTIALSRQNHVFVSQHIGDLDTAEANHTFRTVANDMQRLLGVTPTTAVSDLHPDYATTRYALQNAGSCDHVQHHHAHVGACMAEHELTGEVLGVSWDGTGYGLDGLAWGGEFLLADEASFRRVATFRDFPLPGGDAAAKEPRRVAVGLLSCIFGEAAFDMGDVHPVAAFDNTERMILRRMLARRVNSPRTTSVGRLFDAVASIVGIRQRAGFEGQAAMELEFAIGNGNDEGFYSYRIEKASGDLFVVDWVPMIAEIIHDVVGEKPASGISQRFHNSLVEIVLSIACIAGRERVVLTGGCFQNRYLTELAVNRLRQEGFVPYWHQRIPPNDGGIALGQIYIAAAKARYAAGAGVGMVSTNGISVSV